MEIEKFRQLALAETEAVYRLAFHLARRADAAADLVQQTFTRAVAARNTFQPGERGIRSWLLKILHSAYLAKIGAPPPAPTIMEDLHNDATAAPGLAA